MKLKTVTLCLAIASTNAMAFFDTPTIVKDRNLVLDTETDVERVVYELDKDALPFIETYYHDAQIYDEKALSQLTVGELARVKGNVIPIKYEPDSGHAADLTESYLAYRDTVLKVFKEFSEANKPDVDTKNRKFNQKNLEKNLLAFAQATAIRGLVHTPVTEGFVFDNGFDSDQIEDVTDALEDVVEAGEDHLEDLVEEVFGDIEDEDDEPYGEIEYGDYDGILLIVDTYKVNGHETKELYLIKSEQLAEKTDEMDLEDSKITLSQARSLGLVYHAIDGEMYDAELLQMMTKWLEKSQLLGVVPYLL